MTQRWLQIKGDPSVRRFVFDQERVANDFDAQLDTVLSQTECLLCEHGAFHVKVHFSTGQVTVWLRTDPLRYRVHIKEEFLGDRLLDAYPRQPYAPEAIVSRSDVYRTLNEFGRLRTQDAFIYLRAGSINIVNGIVGLNFSCDGSHYLDYRDFIVRAEEFYAIA